MPSPDCWMYLVGHGANRSEAHLSWMQGDSVYVARGHATADSINNGSAYEFYAGGTGAGAVWSNSLADAAPLINWDNHTGVVTMTYVPALGKYIMCVGTPTVSPSTVGAFDTYLLESDSLTGPWALVAWLGQFGAEAYFVNVPTKFLGGVAPGQAAALSAVVDARELAARLAAEGAGAAQTQGAEGGAGAGGNASAPTAQAAARTASAKARAYTMPLDAPVAGTGEPGAEPGVEEQYYFDFYLSYSANFVNVDKPPVQPSNPPDSGYYWCLLQARIPLSSAYVQRLRLRGLEDA
jgi:hypothetical protein